MTNHNFKMGTFSFRFLENFCQLQRSVGKRLSQNDLARSPIISVCTYVRTAVKPKQLNDACRRRVIFLVCMNILINEPTDCKTHPSTVQLKE